MNHETNKAPEVKIGLEIHVQLDTNSKLFCSCSTQGNNEPNSRCCPVCLGIPGSKPVLNKKALDFAVKICLALNCKLNSRIFFSRKTYFYPDMAKNYQITQYESPLAEHGKLVLSSGKEVKIKRIHLEEDPAALVHLSGIHDSSFVLIDYNRSGNPLVEIVTEPVLESAEQARDFMKQLINILTNLQVFDINTCIIKADTNISVEESNYSRVEVKNITGFKEIERALNYEILRQKKTVSEGKIIEVETRLWNAEHGKTDSLRSKESEDDYGYIFDPDLTLIEIKDEDIKKAFIDLPELPRERAKRFVKQYKIREEDALVLSSDFNLAEIFEKTAKKIRPELAAKWIRREVVKVLNYTNKSLQDSGITESHLIDLLGLLSKKIINEATAQKLLEKLALAPFDVKIHVEQENLGSISSDDELEKYCKEAIAENQKAVDDFKAGSEKPLDFVVGSVMKKTKGKAAAQKVKDILKRLIK